MWNQKEKSESSKTRATTAFKRAKQNWTQLTWHARYLSCWFSVVYTFWTPCGILSNPRGKTEISPQRDVCMLDWSLYWGIFSWFQFRFSNIWWDDLTVFSGLNIFKLFLLFRGLFLLSVMWFVENSYSPNRSDILVSIGLFIFISKSYDNFLEFLHRAKNGQPQLILACSYNLAKFVARVFMTLFV